MLNLYLLIAGVGSVVFLVHSALQVWSPQGATDFHSYWFSGHFVRQGSDPYAAYFNRSQPDLPVEYLGGVVKSEPPVGQPNLSITPANTAPIVLLLSLFSFLSWLPAKVLWSLCNAGLMLLIPWFVVALLPGKLPWRASLAIVLTYYCLQGTRVSIWVGQSTLLVLALMLGSLLVSGRPLLSGFYFGIALSKYSLSLPLAIYYLLTRKFKILLSGLVVQLIGLLLLALLTSTSPYVIAQSYIRMAFHHSTLPGIHLGSLFVQPSWLYYGLLIGGTALVALVIANHYRHRGTHNVRQGDEIANLHILLILCLWGLLVVYHRAYDTTLVILFIALVVYGLVHSDLWRLSVRARAGLIAFLSLFIVVFTAPSSIIALFLPPEVGPLWQQIVDHTMTLMLVAALVVSIALLRALDRKTTA